MNSPEQFRSGYTAIIGKPNVGKSTMMNQILNIKLSIVSARPQTTRHRVMGIYNQPDAQIVFLDTPGLMIPKYSLQEAMMKTTRQVIESADVLLMIIDATDSDVHIPDEVMQTLKSGRCPAIAALNKVDIVSKPDLLPKIAALNETGAFREIVPVSALTGDGLDRLKSCLIQHLPESPPYYPPDTLTEHPERFFVSEIIREKIFESYDKEIPYSTEVMIEEFRERDNRKDFIRAVILVERPGQKGILIGHKGQALKHIGELARKDIELFLDRPVYLELWVKVKENWRKNDMMLRSLGYRS